MIAVIVLISCLICWIAYRFYGGFLSAHCNLNDANKTPAFVKEDGVDYSPTRASVLFGHHFSSIAGAGPIVGPILAATHFGWGPTWIWILIGAILVGGVHDFGSTLMSVRNGGRSIADTMRGLVGERVGKMFMLFVILALIYVIIVFLDLTANTFAKQPDRKERDKEIKMVHWGGGYFWLFDEKCPIFIGEIGTGLFSTYFCGPCCWALFPDG